MGDETCNKLKTLELYSGWYCH